MALFRSLTALLVALSVLVGAFGLASARGQARPVDMIVICAGQGFVTIAIDADGNPVSAPVLCPDGLQGLVDGPLAATEPVARVFTARALQPHSVHDPVATEHAVAHRARAPPVSGFTL